MTDLESYDGKIAWDSTHNPQAVCLWRVLSEALKPKRDKAMCALVRYVYQNTEIADDR